MAGDVAERRAVAIHDCRQGFSQIVSNLAEGLFLASVIVIPRPTFTQIPDLKVVGEFIVAAAMFRDPQLLLPLRGLQLHGLHYRAKRSVNVDPDNGRYRGVVRRRVFEGHKIGHRFVPGWFCRLALPKRT